MPSTEYICQTKRSTLYKLFLKPLADRSVAFFLLLILSPLLIIVILLLAVGNKGSVWFIQARPGYKERIFRVIKFKTMTDQRDAGGKLLPDDQRMTGIGKFIRKTSIDELPQMINILMGDMSFVGPRPLLIEYLPLYNEYQKRRHDVNPGITGWAQVNGRNTLGWKERFEHDVWYVDHQSFLLDLKILFLTLIKVFKAEGISSTTSATMEKFSGNK